jgi:hypothetical protein
LRWIAVLAIAIPLDAAVAQDRASVDVRPIRLAQAADQTTTTPSVTPVTPNSSSATCMSGCSSQALNCQNTCMATANGTTVVPSVTTAGVTSSPNQCAANCSSQQQQCQRGCALMQ